MQALHSGIRYISLIGARISPHIYGGIENAQLQCQSPRWTAVPIDYEYRNSGLSDYQWCKKHGIHPGTFYNWVTRLRKKTCSEIPESISKAEPSPAPVQEVSRLDFNYKVKNSELMFLCQPALTILSRFADVSAMIEISLGNTAIRIANRTDPAILNRVLSLVKGTVCQAISPCRTTSISYVAQQTFANQSMAFAALSGTNLPWIWINHHCSFSVVNSVVGSRSCSMNQMDMCSFIL